MSRLQAMYRFVNPQGKESMPLSLEECLKLFPNTKPWQYNIANKETFEILDSSERYIMRRVL